MNELENRSQWRSFASYVFVTTGALVGLGNVFQFPFLVIKYGGLFVLFYIICQLFIALPLLFAELIIGRRGKQNPVGSISILTMESNANNHWRKLGWLCVFIAFLTMIYYTVTAAFPLAHFINNLNNLYMHSIPTPSTQLNNEGDYSFFQLETWFIVMLLLAMIVVCRGIHRGLENISMLTVPLYFIILSCLAIYISTLGYFGDALSSFVKTYPGITIYEIFLVALAMAFMKYKTGMGVMIVYGSYLPYHVSLATSTLIIILIDALISLFSYFIIFPFTLASSPDTNLLALTGHNVISIFNASPQGLMISTIFFFAVILIAWTPIIAMGETIVVTLMERLNFSRTLASLILLSTLLIFGTVEVWTHIEWAEKFHHMLKNITLDILTPIVVFFISIFVGWVMSRQVSEDELHFSSIFYKLWRFLMRYVVPVAVLIVLFTVTVLESLPY